MSACRVSLRALTSVVANRGGDDATRCSTRAAPASAALTPARVGRRGRAARRRTRCRVRGIRIAPGGRDLPALRSAAADAPPRSAGGRHQQIDAGHRDLVELLAVAGDGVGEVDDIEDLVPPKRVICTARVQVGAGARWEQERGSGDRASPPARARTATSSGRLGPAPAVPLDLASAEPAAGLRGRGRQMLPWFGVHDDLRRLHR